VKAVLDGAILSGADRRERFTISVEYVKRNCAIAAAAEPGPGESLTRAAFVLR
jgi:hypothetical protein